ncbi:hypothetical protein VTJ04DRAFT_10174 [Mycothermus thermophilus]|uniref:uncharacterized protein n=1 Tax=Humicola insolens TaxID=85995 RepID=UPI003743E126
MTTKAPQSTRIIQQLVLKTKLTLQGIRRSTKTMDIKTKTSAGITQTWYPKNFGVSWATKSMPAPRPVCAINPYH